MRTRQRYPSPFSPWLLLAPILLAVAACRPSAETGVTLEEAGELGSLYLEARNTPDLALLDRVYAEDAVVRDASAPGEIVGLEALKGYYRQSHAGFPDFRMSIDETLVSGDRIVYLWTVEGTHSGDFHGMPATGNAVSFSGVAIERVEEGRIVEEWVYFNVLDAAQQMGMRLVPAEPKA